MSHDPRVCEVVADRGPESLNNGWNVKWDTNWDDDDASLSRGSTAPDNETVFTASENGYETDEFDLYPLEEDDGYGDGYDDQRSEVSWQLSCAESTSVSPSVFEDEVAHGRRYHGYRKGRYPLPNDRREQQREEANHAMMLELTVSAWSHSCFGRG